MWRLQLDYCKLGLEYIYIYINSQGIKYLISVCSYKMLYMTSHCSARPPACFNAVVRTAYADIMICQTSQVESHMINVPIYKTQIIQFITLKSIRLQRLHKRTTDPDTRLRI